ncbi:MAG: hypothetical protein JWR32_742 [Mycobacterium sp.]|jgi:hypothetical protein|nr:hypothetical protein [Mycobacterium sp.]
MQIDLGTDSEDTQRLIRLREEVQVRLEEVALIATRKLGYELGPDATLMFRPHTHATDGANPVYIEILDGGPGMPSICVSWNDDGSITVTSPC